MKTRILILAFLALLSALPSHGQTRVGSEFMVNTSELRRPAIAADDEGNFVVIWYPSVDWQGGVIRQDGV